MRKHTWPRTRTRPSAWGVATASDGAARTALAGLSAEAQDAAAPADRREAPCESPGRRSVNCTPASFAHSSAAVSRAPLIGSEPRRGARSAMCCRGGLRRGRPAVGPVSPAPRCASWRPGDRRTSPGSGPRPREWPPRSGRAPCEPGGRVGPVGWTGGLGPVAHDSPCPLKLSRGATDRDNLDGSASSPKRVPEPAVRRTPGAERGRGRVAGIGVDEDGALGVQRDGQLCNVQRCSVRYASCWTPPPAPAPPPPHGSLEAWSRDVAQPGGRSGQSVAPVRPHSACGGFPPAPEAIKPSPWFLRMPVLHGPPQVLGLT